MNKMLFVVCDHCENPLIVRGPNELILIMSREFKCPDCGCENEVTDELRDYVVETA